MSSAFGSGFAFSRVYCMVAPELMHWNVTALPQAFVNSLDTMFTPLVAATARRRPELDSHAMSALSVVTGSALGVIATKLPHVLRSQTHALTWVCVYSPPITPIWLHRRLAASGITGYTLGLSAFRGA